MTSNNTEHSGPEPEHKQDAETQPGQKRAGWGSAAPEGTADEDARPDAGPADEAAAGAESREQALADEVARLKDQLLRALAETENVRRRAQREVEDTSRFAIAGFARDILNVADNLRRALENVPEDAVSQDERVKSLIAGVEMTERELLSAFERHGIRKVDPLGEKFDHDFHQAMFEIEDPNRPAGTVAQVLQPGYVLNGRLLRPALVGVAKGGRDETASVDTTA